MTTIYRKLLLASTITLAASPVMAAFNDAGTDYSNVTTQSWTWTPGLDPLDTANQILCFINNLRAGDMVNKGMYSALVDMNSCQAGQSNGSSKGPNNMFAVVKSTRADDSSPEEVDVWVPDMAQGSGGDAQIHAHAEITASPTSSNPSGQFKMTYRMYALTNLTGSPIEEGQLKSLPNSDGKIDLSFYSNGTDQGGVFAASVVKSPDGSTGDAITQDVNRNTHNLETYKMAWDGTVAPGLVSIEKPDASQVCLNKNDTTEYVYQYGLYDASTGAEVKLNGGFPFEYTRQNGSDGHGYLSYWGAWMDGGDTLTDGMTVKKVDYSTQPPTTSDITLHQSQGRLVKVTTEAKTPASMAKVAFDYWDNSGSQYQVKYLTSAPAGTSGFSSTGFYEVASETQSQNGMTLSPLSTIVLVTPSYGDTLYLNAQQLNGSVVIHYTSGTPDSVILQKQQTMTPDKLSGNLTLYCSFNCPQGGLTSSSLTNPWIDTSSAQAVYTFDATAMTLKDSNGHAVVWPSGSQGSGQFQDGIQSGVLSEQSGATPSSLSTWYTWSTGPNDWDKTTWATNSGGTVITIDPPLNLSLNFASADDRNAAGSNNASSYYGNPLLLQYSGDGQINGLPFSQANNHYVPAISLADGTMLTDANNSSMVYVVKAKQEEKDLNTSSGCSVLSLPVNGTGGVLLPTSVPASDFDAIQPLPASYPQTPSVINGVVKSN